MAENILRLRVESQEYDAKLKRAADGLQRYVDGCRKVGGTLGVVEKETLDFVKAIGRMETTSKTARGSLSEMTKAFTDLKLQYKQLTDAEKASPYGKALNNSLNQLKVRIKETQKDLQDINKELQGGSGKFGQFGSVLDGIGKKMGINANITELLTSQTALLTGAIGVSTTAVVAATKAWADYNSEIAKQQQITTVTTGLKGDDADSMTAAARALVDTYGVDFREAINAANTLMSQFGNTGDETIKLLRDGMQGMINGDGGKLLSMIQNYAPAFRDAGVSASQLVAVIHNSQGGLFSAENMNAIVMGIKNIRLMTKQTGEALAKIGIDGEKVTKALNEGTMNIFDALKLVAGQLKNVDSNSQEAGQVMQAVFGRQGTMAGTNLAKAIEGLNTNLEETKQQTGDVGKAFDNLYQANVRLEQALQNTFGYKGWEEMSTGIQTMLVTAMADVLEKVNAINTAFENNYGVSFFDAIFNAATNALGPLGKMLQLIRDINKEKGSGGGSGKSEQDEMFKYIKGGANRAEREERYNKQLSDINNRLANIGQEKTRKNADGSTSFYIDSPEVQQQQRTQLLNQRTQLVLNRENLLRGQLNKETPIIPIMSDQQKPKGGSGKGGGIVDMIEKDDFSEMEELTGLISIQQQKLADLQAMRPFAETEEEITNINQQIREANEEYQRLLNLGNSEEDPFTEMLPPLKEMNSILKDLNAQLENAETPEAYQNILSDIKAINAEMESFKGNPGITTLKKTGNETDNSWRGAASAISSVSSALQGIQDPSAKIAGIVGQAVANIALGFAQATTASSGAGIFGWIAAIVGGMATMLSTIETIHSATGFANGGVVQGPVKGYASGGTIDGTHYSGDMQIARVNAGETILTRAQAGNLVSQLEGNGLGNLNLSATVKGEDIRISLKNNGRRTGRGEYVTTNFRRYGTGY